jgi:hypothetical protein
MGAGSGAVEFVSLARAWSGPVHGGFRAKHRLVDLSGPSPRPAALETWEVTVARGGAGARPYWSLDLAVTEEAAGASPLALLEDALGGLAFRGRREWEGRAGTYLLTSEGKDRANAEGTRARWAHVSGLVDGVRAGIAILDHPSNFRAPQPVHVHATEPLFLYAPSALGRWEIKAGAPYVARYRLIVQDGPPDPAEIERLWKDYAEPVPVTVTEAR